MDKEAVWRYYGEAAEELGKKPVKDKAGHDGFIQAGYSLQFFYKNVLDHLTLQSPLLSVFLDDENAIDERQWNCEIPLEEDISQWLSADKKPYKNQIEAIRHAVARPLTLIQGPPGTGKTEMILNLLSVIHQKYNADKVTKTVAVVSNNNEAITNITAKIREDDCFSKLRGVYAQWGNGKVLKQWQAEHSEYEEYFLEKGHGNSSRVYRFKPQLLEKIPLFSCTIHSLRKLFVSEELFMQDKYEGDELFDYVIVDECSQVSTLLGLVAMASAKEHLILIGDNEQLAPVIKEDGLKAIEKEYSDEDVPARYRINEANTFLSVCEDIFLGKASNITLNEHYRCHPAIIGFCNDYIYKEPLIVKTEDDGRFPIRILWYEGEYSEYINESEEKEDKDKETLQNMRQTEIFLREEWPLLRKRIEEDTDTSICVISPYRGQLVKLKELLKSEITREKNDKIGELVINDLKLEDEKEGEEKEKTEDKIPCLTIHKSQGKSFDIVCFLSVCDYDSSLGGSWPQQRRMINVVVSRAKKEFHLITCNRWLPEKMQKNGVGYVLSDPENKGDYYLIKFLEYAYQKLQDKNLQDGDFGFHRSAITSLFDRVPLYRWNEEKWKNEKIGDVKMASAPEKCMRNFLVKNFSGTYKVYREVPLRELYPADECKDSKLKRYIKDGSRIDFLICKDKEALLAIEVDGGRHRQGEEEIERNDELKNKCFELLKNKIAFLRINTDGSGCWKSTYDKKENIILSKEKELEELQRIIDKATEASEHREFANENGNAFECTEAKAEDLLEYYKEFLVKKCMPDLEDYLKKSDGKFPSVGYTGKEENDYSKRESDDYYFCKYGIAYAFEYAMMYEIMLRIHDRDQFGVYSFGCGGFIDAWALAYARAKLRQDESFQKDFSLFYQGVDCVRWPETVFGDTIDETWSKDTVNSVDALKNLYIGYGDTKLNITNFTFRKPQMKGIQGFDPARNMNDKYMYYNVLMFPKILNELRDGDVVDEFVKKLNEFKFDKERDYYICVSHSPSDLKKHGSGAKAVGKIVEMFIEKGFSYDDNLEGMLTDKCYENLCKVYAIDIKEELDKSDYKYYIVNKETCYKYCDKKCEKKDIGKIENIDSGKEFKCKKVEDFLKKADEGSNDRKCQQMTNANIVFQIIKFTKKR